MFKRIISLGLCLVMLAVLFAGCGKKTETPTTTTNTDDLPSTINLIGITDKTTTQAAIDLVEEALNKLSKTRYKTKIELTLVTAEDYMKEIDNRVAKADQAVVKVKAITKYNTLAQKQANNAQKLLNESSGKKTNKWTSQVTTVIASTMTTGEVYSAEQTTVYEDGKIETVYPDAQSPIDILMIDGKEMYDELNAKGYLLSVEKKLDEKFTKFKQYIYPTFFDQLKAITGDINAIPNNNRLAEYTYLVIDKTIADAYKGNNGYNIDNFENFYVKDGEENEFEKFLAFVKENYKDVAPMATKPDALGVYQYMDGEVAIGAYFDPIYGYDAAEGTDFKVQNLLAIPEYQAHVAVMKEFQDKGYIQEGATKFAVNVVKGDASDIAKYSENYDIKVIQNPFVTVDAIFDGMLAVSSYTSSEDRALEIIEMFTTDPEAKNIFQYGILDDGDNSSYANYKLVEKEDGKFVVERTNKTYIMDNGLTGNVYMGYPEEGQVFDAWDYYKQANLDSGISPFLLLYVEPSSLDNILTSVLKRAALTEALDALQINYDDYVTQVGKNSNEGIEYIRTLRNAHKAYLISELAKTDATFTNLDFVANANASAAVKEFIKFAQSKEGQAILANAGYYPTVANAESYQKAASLSGEITMYADTSSVGTNTKEYIDSVFDGLINAFTAMYPEVKITRPEPNGLIGYNKPMSNVTGNANALGVTYATAPETLEVTTVAKNYLSIFANPSNSAFSQSWFENRIVDRVKTEKYADIISASDLEKLIQNKVAVLGGATNPKDEVDAERVTLAGQREKATNYYTNIKYLRVMADLILFEDLSDEERARYDSMTDLDFEAAVYAYVKANYETENNLTDEEYKKRVQDFMASVLEFTSEEDSTTKYLVSWEEFTKAEEGATKYISVAEPIVAQYRDILKRVYRYSDNKLNSMSLDELMDLVYTAMYDEYVDANGFDKTEFDQGVQNKYLKTVGTNAEDFKTYSKTSDEYKNYVSKLRKKYKAILIDNFSSNAYKNGEKGISNEKVVSTLYEHFLEEELGFYSDWADMANMSKEDFLVAEKDYANYDRYISTMKTKFVYTLRTVYEQSEINKWSLAEAKTNIYNILYDTGFYTNELARYIGLELSEYMLSKSDAVAYQNSLKKIADALASEITAKGKDKDILLKGDGTELEALAREIVAEKFFADMVGITDVMKDLSGKYVKDYDNVDEMKAYAEKLSKNGFFMAVVNELQAMWDEQRAELEK